MADSNQAELRGMCPQDVVVALDAIAMAKGTTRNAYVVQVLTAEVKRYLDELTVVQRTLQGNPLLTDAEGKSHG